MDFLRKAVGYLHRSCITLSAAVLAFRRTLFHPFRRRSAPVLDSKSTPPKSLSEAPPLAFSPALQAPALQAPALLHEFHVGDRAPERHSDWMRGEIIQEIERFVRTQRSAHTQRAYGSDLKQFLGWLRAERYSPGIDALLDYRDYLVRPKEEAGLGLTRGSANRKFATVRAFLGWLQSRGFLKENPAIWVKNFRAKVESPTQGFSDSQVARILEMPNLHTRSGIMHALILHILFYLGLRRSEVVSLKCSHFGQSRVKDQVMTTVRVQGKGDKERILPIPPTVIRLLEIYMERTGLAYGMDRYLFNAVKNNVSKMTQVREMPLNTNTIAYIVKKYSEKAGIDANVSPHSCRATCISNALDQGAPHRAVQQMAGWSSPLMIERYDKRQTDLANSAVHVVHYPNKE